MTLRFYVTLQGRNSRWRVQKEGLPQGSVMAPTLFNVYTNDQPIGEDSQHFVCANDLAVMAQGDNFEMVENKLEKIEDELKDVLSGKFDTHQNDIFYAFFFYLFRVF